MENKSRQFSLAEQRSLAFLLPVLYFFGRLVLFLALIPNNLYGFGDLSTYFEIAGLKGWPYFQSWSEYPPLFPFFNTLTYRLASGQEFLYDFLMILCLSLMGSACIYIFSQIARRLYGEAGGMLRTVIFFAILAPLPYTWWYFDLAPAFLSLLALFWLLNGKDRPAGLAIGLGILVKYFPGLILPAVWRYRSWKEALKVTLIALGLVALVFGGLSLVSPVMTTASLHAQTNRTSWETVWALIDNNFNTGNFILLSNRTDPQMVSASGGHPARIPTWLTLPLALLAGLWLFWKAKGDVSDHKLIAFTGITWAVYYIWSPGWSPQWILYLIPLILLTFPWDKAIFWNILLILLEIIEWPLMLSHHFWSSLWLIVPLRMLLFIALIVGWYRQTRQPPILAPAYLAP